ncbi:MAG: PQQ-binding-like beta-propeller repeat protein, partial [Pseudomonadota bacterium]|nr:PQQ-binding-like beta-propeller repeat protein [Pseudomonadota bacterium]
MKRLVFALCGLAMLSGCGALKLGKDDPTTPTLGNRISVLSGEADIAVDPELASVTIALPAPVATRDWAQPGGNAAKNPGHVAIGDTLARAWSIDIGAGSTTKARLAAAPVVANGVVYTIDTASTVRALSAANGGQIWEAQVRGEGGAVSLFGGRVSYDNG